MRFVTLAAAALSLAAVSPAVANTPAGTVPGMKVKDTAGAVVGTVVKIDATTVTVRTGKHDITIPGQSFTLDQGVLLFGMTQAQLDASFEAAEAAAQAALQVGLPVKGAAGSVVGTIADINEEEVTLDVEGAKVVLPRRAIVGSPDGAVIGLTIEQLKAQLPDSAKYTVALAAEIAVAARPV